MSAKQVAQVLGVWPLDERMDLKPYKFANTKILFGALFSPLRGVNYVSAKPVNPKTKRFQCLTGSGQFVHNVNQSGIIEIGMLRGSPSQGRIELENLAGIPYPIVINDTSSGGTSSVVATECQMVSTPEWRRDALPDTNVYTFETTRILIVHGIQLPYNVE